MRDCRIVLPCAAIFGLLLAACGGGTSASPLGTSVAVAYTDDTTNVTTDLEVTVLGVRQGTVAELVASGLQFDDDEQDLVPFYVDARYTNTGSETVGRGMRVALEDDTDALISPTIVLDFSGGQGGDPEGPCVDVKDGELAPGETLEDCTLFVVDPGTDVATVTFLSRPATGEPTFVDWVVE